MPASKLPSPVTTSELAREKGQSLTVLVQFAIFLILVLQTATALWSIHLFHQVTDLSAWTARAQRVQTLLQRLDNNLYKSESSQRGYLFTGDSRLLEEYEATSDFTGPLQELRGLLSDPEELRRCDRLHELLGEMRLWMNRQNALLNTGSVREAQLLTTAGEGPRLRESILKVLQEMMFTERDILSHREAELKNALSWQEGSLSVSLVLILLTGGFVIRLLAVKG